MDVMPFPNETKFGEMAMTEIRSETEVVKAREIDLGRQAEQARRLGLEKTSQKLDEQVVNELRHVLDEALVDLLAN